MTTVEYNLIDTFALFDLGAIKSIDKENTRTIKNWPGMWPHPFIFNSIRAISKIYSFKKRLNNFFKKIDPLFANANEEGKMELYAIINRNTDIINDLAEEIDLTKEKYNDSFLKRYYTRSTQKMVVLVNLKDEYYYKLAYPDKPDSNDPEFIRQVCEAHKKADLHSSDLWPIYLVRGM